MELSRLFQDFNHSKFVVHFSLFIFVFLFALRLDETITWSWWVVFSPIWIWKSLVFLGALFGTIVWLRSPQRRSDTEGIIQYRAMWLTVAVHCFLFLFELLACEQLETAAETRQRSHRWILVFLPLIFVSLLSFFVCIWSLKRERPFELEMFCAVNIVQFVFFALKFDEIISWSYVVVFIPLWILTAVTLVGVSYSVIFACLVMRSHHNIATEQRYAAFRSALSSSVIVLPLMVTEVLLVYRLDGYAPVSFLFCSVPLLVALLTLMFMACGSRGGFFGLRKDFCHSILATCPCLREYGNIKIIPPENQVDRREIETDETAPLREVMESRADLARLAKIIQGPRLPCVAVISIDGPD